MPGPSCRVTTRALQLHSRLPGAGLMTFLSRVTCIMGQFASWGRAHSVRTLARLNAHVPACHDPYSRTRYLAPLQSQTAISIRFAIAKGKDVRGR